MSRLLVALLRAYQVLLSPLIGQNCRFYPTCSNYAIEALRVHGAGRGSLLAARRVCRCHPWNDGGVDLVPPPLHEQNKAQSTSASACNHS